jgi:release factor glutamine methyltransferase
MEVYKPQEDSFLLQDAILTENLSGKNCLDLGTGGGIQTRAMAKAGAKKITAVDLNPDAIKTAMENNKDIADKITFFEGDLFNFVRKDSTERFDFIAFNPPYLPSEKIKWRDLDGGKKGREIIDIFLEEFYEYLAPKGILFLLVSSFNDEKDVIKILEKKGMNVAIVARKKLFFEELFVLSAVKD